MKIEKILEVQDSIQSIRSLFNLLKRECKNFSTLTGKDDNPYKDICKYESMFYMTHMCADDEYVLDYIRAYEQGREDTEKKYSVGSHAPLSFEKGENPIIDTEKYKLDIPYDQVCCGISVPKDCSGNCKNSDTVWNYSVTSTDK